MKEWTLETVERGIEKLKRRLRELEVLADGDRKDPKVKVFESELKATVEDVFGPGSREQQEYRYFQISKIKGFNRGESEWVKNERDESWFREGAREKVALVQGLINRLEELKGDFDGVQSSAPRAGQLDQLGLFRKEGFNHDLPEFSTAAVQAGLPISLVMIDLDKFKPINDTHGHPAGDEVLQFVADAIKRITGERGRCYRFGGDEFSILLPNHETDEAASLAERIRKEIEAASIGNRGLAVTASLGVAEIPAHASTANDLLTLADAALYDAKDLGHNLVRISGEGKPSTDQPRVAARRMPDSSRISEAEAEKIRVEWFRAGYVVCPRDGSQLRIDEIDYDEKTTPDLDVSCPFCGLSERIPGPS